MRASIPESVRPYALRDQSVTDGLGQTPRFGQARRLQLQDTQDPKGTFMRTRLLVAGLAGATLLAISPAQAADYNTITSFDETPITFYWFPAVGLAPGQTAPTVLQGPGFGGQAQSNPEATSGGPIPGVGSLRQAGYNVLTWNPRGISPSGGEAMLDNPDYEGRDVQALID